MEAIQGSGKVDLSNQVSVLVARKALDSQRQQGQAALDLLKAASSIQKAAADPSKTGLDLYA